jgi:hypothetical protein
MSRKILIIGDLHCGSMCGLTPPDWIVSKGRNEFYSNLQKEMWDNYLEMCEDFGKVDALIVNGDAIDGKGTRSGSTEQITADMFEQCDMAVKALEHIDARQVMFTYGTPYHTALNSGEDFDKEIADRLNAPIQDELNVDVDGLIFNVKHKVGSSSSPYNRAMPAGRHRLWDALEALRTEQKPADVYVRSHVHYFSFCGESKWYAFTLPALQSSETKYGARQCVGLTDWGMCMFMVDDGILAGWDCRLYDLTSHKKRIIKIR